jgi:pimeloyl-ACP methyl ester carboxylesterase
MVDGPSDGPAAIMPRAITIFPSAMSRLTRHWLLLLGLAVVVVAPALAVQRQTAWSMTVPNLYAFQYLLYMPAGYDTDVTGKWPLMVFLHGSGERGTDVERVAANGPPMLIEQGRNFPCVVVSPQCSGSWWSATDLQPFIEDLVRQYRIDPDRVYLTGLSMGGFGTWDLAVRSPGFYAAIAPLCGGGAPSQAYQLRDLPVWAFHGALDTTVPVAQTQQMIDAIRQAGGNPLVTIYPDLGHDVWTVTYANDALYTWLFAQNREQVSPAPTASNHAVPPPVTVAAPVSADTPTPGPGAATSNTGGGGGGGGAIEWWFVVALGLLGMLRQLRRKA